MLRIRNVVLGILAIPFVCIALLFVALIGYHILGFVNGWYVNEDVDKVIAIAVEKKDARECGKMREFLSLGIGTAQQSMYCTLKVAEKLKDPQVCELLLPNEYALNCVGQVESEATAALNTKFYDAIPEPHCEKITDSILHKDECFVGTAYQAHDPTLCRFVGNSIMREACTLKLEAWQKYPELRTSIYFGEYRQK